MSYFTETFESILELKSDIDKANTRRQLWDQQSGYHNHSFQKYNSKDAHEFGNSLNNKRGIRSADSRNRTNDDIKAQDDAYLKRRAADRARAKADPAYAEQKKKEAMERRTKHESFDPVYEDLCRMGIID